MFSQGRYKAIWKEGIQTPMAQGRSANFIPMIKWIQTSRLSIKNSLCATCIMEESCGTSGTAWREHLEGFLEALIRVAPCPE
jgi:hypothetical protein